MTVDIVIVNWNSAERLRRCIHSLSSWVDDVNEVGSIIVFDNASTDGSAHRLRDIEKLIVYNSDKNLGFAAACNYGANLGRGKYILFLNPDTIVDKPESVLEPIERLEAINLNLSEQNVGIAGIRLLNRNLSTGQSLAYLPTPMRVLAKSLGLANLFSSRRLTHFYQISHHLQSGIVEQIMGAFFMIRRSLFENLNGFDEQFFLYYEEVDLTRRAAEAGWASYYFSDLTAIHEGRCSTSVIIAERLFLSTSSRILYIKKHFHTASAVTCLVFILFIEPVVRILSVIIHKPSNIRHTLRAWSMLARWIFHNIFYGTDSAKKIAGL